MLALTARSVMTQRIRSFGVRSLKTRLPFNNALHRPFASSSQQPTAVKRGLASGVVLAGAVTFFGMHLLGNGTIVNADDGSGGVKQQPSMARRIFSPIFSVYDSIQEYLQPTDLLLPDEMPNQYGERPRTIVLNLNGTLVKSVWTRQEGWRTRVRPYAESFMRRLYQAGYEIVIFSSNTQHGLEGGEQMVSEFDKVGVVQHRLYRKDTTYKEGQTTKDLSRLNRDERRIILVDHLASSGLLQPDNFIQIKEFDDDIDDNELEKLIVFLECLHKFNVVDVKPKIKQWNQENKDVEAIFRAEKQELDGMLVFLQEKKGGNSTSKMVQQAAFQKQDEGKVGWGTYLRSFLPASTPSSSSSSTKVPTPMASAAAAAVSSPKAVVLEDDEEWEEEE